MSRNGQPVVVQGGLLFEGPVKDFLDVVEAESANGRARQSVGRRRKRGVNNVHPFALVAAFVRAGRRFCSNQTEKNKERKKIKRNSHTTVVPICCTKQKGKKEKLTDFVKVKRVISRDGTVESRLEERRPAVAELVGSASIRFANAGDPRVHRL